MDSKIVCFIDVAPIDYSYNSIGNLFAYLICLPTGHTVQKVGIEGGNRFSVSCLTLPLPC